MKTVVSKTAQNRTTQLCKAVGLLLFVCALLLACYWSWHNDAIYRSPIAKITKVSEKAENTATGTYGEREAYREQTLTLFVTNSSHRGETYQVKNSYAKSQVKSIQYKKNDRVFVSFYQKNGKTQASIRFLKRDSYLFTAFLLFVFFLIAFVGKRGMRILVSMLGNTLLFALAVLLFTKGIHLGILTAVLMICQSIATLFLIGGVNRKMAITALSTVVTILIVFFIYRIVIACFKEIPYYMVDYLVYSHNTMRNLFMVSVLFGSLGAVMDVSITICSSLYELMEVKPDITRKELLKSLQAMGRDIMGTMQNVLLFTYIVGAFPNIILMMKSGYMITNLLKYDFSFEVARFLTGSIGIVLAVPVSGMISVLVFHRGYGIKRNRSRRNI